MTTITSTITVKITSMREKTMRSMRRITRMMGIMFIKMRIKMIGTMLKTKMNIIQVILLRI